MARPNIVLILADDMGYGDLSCLNEAGKIHTPHLDRLAAEGMTFTDAHASSAVCTPSRYSILTGRYAWRSRLKNGVLGPLEPPLIEEGRLTLPQLLRTQGYRTGCMGKWHLGMSWPFADGHEPLLGDWRSQQTQNASLHLQSAEPVRGGPVDRGFDTYFGVDVPNFPPYGWIEDDRLAGAPDRMKPEAMYGVPGAMTEGWDLEAIMPTLTQKAVDFVEANAAGAQPFFLYFPLTGPHTPICPTPAFRGHSEAGIYGDWVMQMDAAVGAVLEALDRCGLAEDTLLLFASDNGSPGRNGSAEDPGTVLETFGHNPSWILRGMKADIYEGGHRVPFLARWPGRIQPGTCAEGLVCLMDLMATCADLTGAALPAGAAEDSLSLRPYLLGDATAGSIRESLVHHSHHGLFAMRKGAWKYIAGWGSGGFSANAAIPSLRDTPRTQYDPPEQLYHLADDLREAHNLWGDRQTVVADLAGLLTRFRFVGEAPR